MKVERRDFLRASAIFGAGIFTFSPALNAFSQMVNQSGISGAGEWLPSTCQGCTTWCPIEVYVQGGRAVKVRGNQNSKVNPGTCCSRGHLIPQQMYDPDRVKVPMKRTNPIKGKGIDPKFVPITWDEALGTLADKMIELRAAGETHKFMVLRGRYAGLTDILYSAVPKIFGSPNGISHSAICAEAEKSGAYWTEAYWDYRDYDILNTKYLVLWGVDPFRSNRQVPGMISRWPQIRENAKVVTIDPFYTASAAKSDKWVAIKPGEDGALASAIAHHILVKGMWHKEFVGNFNGSGVNSFKPNVLVNASDFTEIESNGVVKWWNIELKDKTLDWAASVTGIAATTIKEIAEEMASKAPNVSVWYGPGPVMSPRGTYTAMAIYALNGLLGSVDNVGGPIRKPSISTAALPSNTDYLDAIAKTGSAKPKIDQRGTLRHPAMNKTSGAGVVTNNVANAMLAADPYDIKVAIGYWCNFTFSGTQPKRWYDAMSKLPFFAHITTNASEMTQFADIILPAAHPTTERICFVQTSGNMHSELSIQQPLAKRLFDVKSDESEISFLLAEKLRSKGFPNMYDYFTKAFADPVTGAKPANETEFALIATKMATYPSYKDLSGGWNEFLKKGVVTKGPYIVKKLWGGKFGTATGKFEFYSETLKKALGDHAKKHNTTIDVVLKETNYEARGELAFVPHYEQPYRWGDKLEYPFDFVDVKSRFNREGRSANLPISKQFQVLDPGDLNWEDCIKINPVDAASIGIIEGDRVLVKSVVGELKTKARLWEGVRPGTVVKTFGSGHWAYGRFASNYDKLEEIGGNNNEIMPDDYDRISGSTARNGGFVGVKITKA
ncbi:MAG: molybdopterin-dependent oxidoreductase [Bacteroidota bacterium]|nr:molybdopterin-dependent oxidoreductase [Bacteroidota bacterium]